MIEPEDHAPLCPEPDDPLPDYQHDPLEALGVQVGADDGAPPPVHRPHALLLRECAQFSLTLHAVVRVLERRGLLTAVEVGVERDAIAAEDATDAAVGLVRRLLDEGLIEPLSTTLARSERTFPCGCTHAVRTEEEDAR